jgi:hypothetical protein
MREATDKENLYKRWRDAAYQGLFAPVSADDPWLGKFRIKNKSGPWVPISIELESPTDPETGELDGDEEIVGVVGFRGRQMKVSPLDSPSKNPETDYSSWWLWAATHPVTEEDYWAAFEGGSWPDDAPGSNVRASDDFDTLVDQIVSATEIAAEIKTIEDKRSADQAANLKDRIVSLHKACEEMRVAEKRVFDEGARAVQAKYVPHIMAATSAIDYLRKLLTPYMVGVAEKAKAAVVAAGGSPEGVEVKVRAGGMSGRRTGTRKVKVVTINDQAAAFAHIMATPGPEVIEALTKAVNRRATAGEAIPGVTVTEETKVI